jgi:hypothetical protein
MHSIYSDIDSVLTVHCAVSVCHKQVVGAAAAALNSAAAVIGVHHHHHSTTATAVTATVDAVTANNNNSNSNASATAAAASPGGLSKGAHLPAEGVGEQGVAPWTQVRTSNQYCVEILSFASAIVHSLGIVLCVALQC